MYSIANNHEHSFASPSGLDPAGGEKKHMQGLFINCNPEVSSLWHKNNCPLQGNSIYFQTKPFSHPFFIDKL